MACEILTQGRCEPVFPSKLLQGGKISSDHQNIIVVESSNGNIVLDCQIKSCNSQVAIVKFLHETYQERAQSANVHEKKNTNDLHVELGHPSKVITHATTKSMGIQVNGNFKLCEDCTQGKAEMSRVCKKVAAYSKILGEQLFFHIISPATPNLEVKSIGYLS